MVLVPHTAKELAKELSPMLEELVNLRFLLERDPSNRTILEAREAIAFERVVNHVLRVLAD
jgi:ribosomal protein L29